MILRVLRRIFARKAKADLKIFTDNIDNKALEQVNELMSQPAFANAKVRIMPDVHAGIGCVIGFTGDLGKKVIPNIVGVDIGCGMECVELGKVDLDFERLDKIIRKHIAFGKNVCREEKVWFCLEDLKAFSKLKNKQRLRRSIGSLGGGNHFIEIDADDEGRKYLVVHTGSRNLGKQICDIYQQEAIEHCSLGQEAKKKKSQGKTKLPKALCYLEDRGREEYLHDMKLCQHFASLNRQEIAREILSRYFERAIDLSDYERFETVHNYISFEDNIVRKGAISAKKGERLLIPMNMRDGCLLCVGKGNADWTHSAPHGAGRIMSRTKAMKELSVKEFAESMKGVYTTTVSKATLDEAPAVYKPAQEIIERIGDTVEIVKIIKPIYNFKAAE